MRAAYTHYRVYPPEALYPSGKPRVKTFRYFEKAMEYAAEVYTRQGILPEAHVPVQIVTGSGGDFKVIGHWTESGWKESTWWATDIEMSAF